jgi:hypothetical protein
MRNVTPLRLGVFGAVCFVGGLGWFAFWFIGVRIPDSPALEVYRDVPDLPRIVSLLGILMVITSLGWAVVARTRSRARDRKA